MNIKQLTEELNKLLEDNNVEETKQILLELIDAGFSPICWYSKDFDENGRDYNNDMFEVTNNKKEVIDLKDVPEIEDDRILLDEYNDYDSGEYASGGSCADDITYSSYYVETTAWTYFYPSWHEDLKMTAAQYVVQNYPESELCKMILQVGLDKLSNEDDVSYYSDDIINDVEYKK